MYKKILIFSILLLIYSACSSDLDFDSQFNNTSSTDSFNSSSSSFSYSSSSFNSSSSSFSFISNVQYQDTTYKDIVLADNNMIYLIDNSRLMKWDIENNILTEIYTFTPGSINKMIISDDLKIVYIAAGLQLWQYIIATETLTHVYNSPETIMSLFYAGNYLIIVDTSGAWESHRLINRFTFQEYHSQDWNDYSRTSLYNPSNNCVYYLDDGSTDDAVQYVKINTNLNQMETWGSGETYAYNTAHPIKMAPDCSRIYTAAGTIFNTNSSVSYMESLGTSYTDLVFYNNSIIIIHTYNYLDNIKSKILQLNSNYPYSIITTIDEFIFYAQNIFVHNQSLYVTGMHDGYTVGKIIDLSSY